MVACCAPTLVVKYSVLWSMARMYSSLTKYTVDEKLMKFDLKEKLRSSGHHAYYVNREKLVFICYQALRLLVCGLGLVRQPPL